jgi:hypothetical protein
MSVVAAWINADFAAVCCDGRLSRKGADGSLIPVGEHYRKIHLLTEDIVLASTGSQFVADRLVNLCEPLVLGHPDGSGVFGRLERAIPAYISGLLSAAVSMDAPQEVAVLLAGWDAAQSRIRSVFWRSEDDLAPVEPPLDTNTVGAFGGDAMPLVKERLMSLRDREQPRLQDVLPEMERCVREVAELVPWSINKNLWSRIVVRPALRSAGLSRAADPLRPRDEELLLGVADGVRAAWTSVTQKNAAVDSSGNLLLKNIASPTPTTSGPSTNAGAYVVVPEMTSTIVTKGNKVFITFWMVVLIGGSAANVFFALFRDGVQLTANAELDAPGVANKIQFMSMTFVDSPSAGSHTYDARWNAGSIVSGVGTARQFQAVELG